MKDSIKFILIFTFLLFGFCIATFEFCEYRIKNEQKITITNSENGSCEQQ